jgi:ferredoxin-type protein NapG
LSGVDMGHARVDESLCLSYQGKTCGVCYRACPLPDVAIYVGRLEQPHVTDNCVGCGLCERSCIQMPQAIRVFPERAA